jgi:hypothetical protein
MMTTYCGLELRQGGCEVVNRLPHRYSALIYIKYVIYF